MARLDRAGHGVQCVGEQARRVRHIAPLAGAVAWQVGRVDGVRGAQVLHQRPQLVRPRGGVDAVHQQHRRAVAGHVDVQAVEAEGVGAHAPMLRTGRAARAVWAVQPRSTFGTALGRSRKASGMPEPSSGRRYSRKASVTSVPLAAMKASSMVRVLPATASRGSSV